jgi:hypothetical protein
LQSKKIFVGQAPSTLQIDEFLSLTLWAAIFLEIFEYFGINPKSAGKSTLFEAHRQL